jgi:hypothetical protein
MKAMKEIERQIEQNQGTYPFTKDGRVSVQEVLRRAGMSAAVLEKPHHKKRGGLNEIVTEWSNGINRKVSGGVKIVRRMIFEQVDEANLRLKAFRQAWVEAELEYIEAQDLIAKSEKVVSALEDEVRRLKEGLEGAQIVSLNRQAP